MASRYWVGGTGTWDSTTTTHWAATSGGAGGASVPTNADDVFFDGSSGGGTVTTSTSSTCKNVNFTGFTGTISGGIVGGITGNLTFSSTMSTSSGTNGWTFNGSGAQAITSAGKQFLNTVNFSGTGTYTLQDAAQFNGASGLGLNTGTLNTNNFAVTAVLFASSGSTVRTLTLGSSSVTLTGTASSTWNTSTATGLTITANTATVTFTGTSTLTLFNSASNVNYNGLSLVFSGASTPIMGASGCTFANVTRTGTATKTDGFSISGSPTITGTFTVTGNSVTNRLLVSSGTAGTQRTITAAAVSLTNVDFMDIAGAGAASWTGTSLGNCQGNSGITFDAPMSLYRVDAGTTQWDANGSSNGYWASSSGGALGTGRVPLPQDDVYLDANTGSASLTVNMPRMGRNVDMTGFTGTLSISITTSAFGNWANASGMTLSGGSNLTMGGRSTSQTFKSAGKNFSGAITFNAPGGKYTLLDAVNSGGTITQAGGDFDSGGFAISVAAMTINNIVAVCTITNSTISIKNAGSSTAWSCGTSITLNAVGSNIVYSVAATVDRNFVAGGQTYDTVTYTVANSSGAVIISGGATIATLSVSPGRKLTFGGTTTITNWLVAGQNYGYVYLPGASTSGDYISAPDSAALSITGDLDLRCRVALDDWTPTPVMDLISKEGSSTTRSYVFRVSGSGSGTLQFYISADGTNIVSTAQSSVAPTVVDGAVLWARVTWRQSDGRVQFFTASGALANPNNSTDWTQLGTDQSIVAASIADTTAGLEIGSRDLSLNERAAGKFYRAQVLSGIGGTVAFDADFTSKPFGADTFVESSSNAATVTLNGNAQQGDGRVLINSTSAGSQAVLVKTGAAVGSDYLTIKDSSVTPASTWYAGSHSVDKGNNTHWLFTDPQMSFGGSITLSGTPAVDPTQVSSTTGSLTLGGTPAATASAPAAAGSLELAGAPTATVSPAPSGSLTLAGTPSATASAVASGGSLTLAGAVAATVAASVLGSLSLAGSPVVSPPTVAAGGVLTLGGAAVVTALVSALGHLELSGAATGRLDLELVFGAIIVGVEAEGLLAAMLCGTAATSMTTGRLATRSTT